MKKIIAMLLVLAAAFALVACGAPAASAPAKKVEGTMEEIATKIMEANPVEFMGGFRPVDLADTSEDGLWNLSYCTGLQSAEKLSDIAVYEPMMMAQAFSLVLVRVTEGTDAKAVAQEIKDNINPAKWVCVSADDVAVAGFGDVVMLYMANSEMGIKSQDFVDAFKTVCGADLDFTI